MLNSLWLDDAISTTVLADGTYILTHNLGWHGLIINLLSDIRNESYMYDMTEYIPSNQAGLRIQIRRNKDDNINRLFYGAVTLINSIGATVSNDINISK